MMENKKVTVKNTESQEGYQNVCERIENRDGVSIPNDEFLERSDKEIVRLIDIVFHKIESNNIPVDKMLISPEIEKRLLPLKTKGITLYEKTNKEDVDEVYEILCDGTYGQLWTARVQVIEELNEVVFLSSDKEYLDFYTDTKRIL